MKRKVTTTSLEMRDPGELQPARPADLDIIQTEIACPELNRFFYTAVGGDWYWIDRLSWTLDQWREYLEPDEVQTWIAYNQGAPVGYLELEKQEGDNVEIGYFGLLPQFAGKGFGGHFLTEATRKAWAMKARRVWLHTCSLDGPNALNNYKSRGFKVFDVTEDDVELPDSPPGPWPGAR